jgi:hypothetical protein
VHAATSCAQGTESGSNRVHWTGDTASIDTAHEDHMHRGFAWSRATETAGSGWLIGHPSSGHRPPRALAAARVKRTQAARGSHPFSARGSTLRPLTTYAHVSRPSYRNAYPRPLTAFPCGLL